ncbi:MAG: DUF485 domain-containing protein [Dermatophilaceae bacterium]|jgi:uncharacterized membrane protein (DUF485 family)|nr:DUF485 domain-containing protein [Dermatophilaceae bacterium]MBP9918111.1 DUF485 domain-containing protein [Dermatophilaceae bacterium]
MPPSTTGAFNAEQYRELESARKKLVTPLVIITAVAFWAQQIITNFTNWMDGSVFAGMTWAYLYAFALFFLVIAVTTYYRRQMAAIEAKYKPNQTGEQQ